MKLASAVGWLGRRGMFTSLLLVTGVTAMAVGLMMLLAAGVSLLYGEMSDARGIGAAAAVTLATGTLLRYSVGQPIALTTRAGFAGVGVAWLMMSAFGTLPYLFSGAIPDVTNAAFETVSGFTTTGASLLADPGQLSHGILFWRSLTQWMGGMGIIVLFVAVLPLLGVGGMELARAESPGGDPDRLTPRFQDTAKRLGLLGEPAAQVAEADDVVAVVAEAGRQEQVRHLEAALFGQEEKSVFAHRRIERRAALLPVGQQLVQRPRVEHGAGQDMRADLRALLQNADLDVAAAFRGKLLQADRGGQARRAGADDHHVVFHRFAVRSLFRHAVRSRPVTPHRRLPRRPSKGL